jgi:hypothetical protein
MFLFYLSLFISFLLFDFEETQPSTFKNQHFLTLHCGSERLFLLLLVVSKAQQPPLQLSGVSCVPTFGGGSDSADLWLVQLWSYFLFAPNLDSNAKKIFFAATRMYSQALMWFQTWLGGWRLMIFKARLTNLLMNFWNTFLLPINVEHARLRLMSSSFSSGMSVEDFYSKHFLPSLLQAREPNSQNRALFCARSCHLA